jgi:colanic acid/amylovoran biosynthesis glycosyltransferase
LTKIGYMIPEFPGQTHNFFWRERTALRRLGVECDLVSTRLPPTGLRSTSWEAEAIALTTYLYPLSPRDIAQAFAVLGRGGPSAWRRVFRALRSAELQGWRERVFFAGFVLIGAKLVHLARAHGWTHVHVHSCANAANIALQAHLIGGISYSLTLHNPLWVYGSNQRMKWRNAFFAIVITNAVRQDVLTALGTNLPPRIAVAPMGVELDVFKRSKPYHPYDGVGAFRIFCCARLSKFKGQRGLAEAVAMLRDKGLDIALRIAGEDDHGGAGYRLELEADLRSLGYDPATILLGPVPEAAVRAEIENAHIFVLNSDEEPLGVALMEAMAMETPVIATRAGGVPELVIEGENGVLVPPQDPVALAGAIEALLADPDRCLALGRAGRATIAESFSSDRSASVIAGFVRELATETDR